MMVWRGFKELGRDLLNKIIFVKISLNFIFKSQGPEKLIKLEKKKLLFDFWAYRNVGQTIN